jgi:hypothetical protein
MKGSSPNPLWRTFGLVHGNQHGNHSNTETGEDTAHDEERKGEGSGLHGDTGGEDEDGEDDGPSPTEEICGGGGEESTEESTGGQDGDDEGLLGGGNGARSGGVGFAKGTQPILHGLDTGDDTGIITKEDTTEGGEEGLQRRRWSESGGDQVLWRKWRRTERTPAQTFLGALPPMPGPVAAAPPAMVEEEVRVWGGGRLVLWEGGKGERRVPEQWIGEGKMAPSYIGDSPGTEGNKSGREGEIDIATGYPLPTLAVDSGRSSSTPAHFSFSVESFTPCTLCSIHTCSLLSPSRSECGPRSAKSDLSSVAQIQQEGGFSIGKKLDGKWSHASLARVAV